MALGGQPSIAVGISLQSTLVPPKRAVTRYYKSHVYVILLVLGSFRQMF